MPAECRIGARGNRIVPKPEPATPARPCGSLTPGQFSGGRFDSFLLGERQLLVEFLALALQAFDFLLEPLHPLAQLALLSFGGRTPQLETFFSRQLNEQLLGRCFCEPEVQRETQHPAPHPTSSRAWRAVFSTRLPKMICRLARVTVSSSLISRSPALTASPS